MGIFNKIKKWFDTSSTSRAKESNKRNFKYSEGTKNKKYIKTI